MSRRNMVIAGMLAALALAVPAPGRAQNEPEKYGFGFINYSTRQFGWEIYRRSYFGIPADSTDVCAVDPFACLFYDQVFKTKLPDPGGTGNGAGNCFGISALSLMMNKYGGYLGYCAPTINYDGDTTSGGGATGPSDAQLNRTINIMHGHQLALASIESYIEQAISGHSQNGSYGVTLAQQGIAREGPVVVSVTKDWNPLSGGHAMIAYKVTGSPGSYKIWVVDPNRLWVNPSPTQRGWYTSASNYISVSGASWSFVMAGTIGTWPSGSGHLIVLPLSVVGPTGRSPASLGLGIVQLLTKIFIWGNDEKVSSAPSGAPPRIVQMTDARGHRLFLDGRAGIDWDTSTGMCNVVPWMFTAGSVDVTDQLDGYYHLGDLRSTSIQVESGSRGATLVAGGGDGYVRVRCQEPGARLVVRLSDLATAAPTISIGASSRDVTVDIEIMTALDPGRLYRFYTLSGASIPMGAERALTLSVRPPEGVAVAGASSRPAVFQYRQTSSDHARDVLGPATAVDPSVGGMVYLAPLFKPTTPKGTGR